MAGDWIKMRPSLISNPKVNGIARELERRIEVTGALSTGFSGTMSEIVTRNVMRNVTIASLLIVWGAANEHTDDGVFKNTDLIDIDDMVGIPGFGAAMQAAGWAYYDEENFTVTLPNFNEYNTCGKDRAKEKNAERQKRYREKHKNDDPKSNDLSNVTNDVTNNGREEKRREDIYIGSFDTFWELYPRKTNKPKALSAWKKLKPDDRLVNKITNNIFCRLDAGDWDLDRKDLIPHASTYLNNSRWEDEVIQRNRQGQTQNDEPRRPTL